MSQQNLSQRVGLTEVVLFDAISQACGPGTSGGPAEIVKNEEMLFLDDLDFSWEADEVLDVSKPVAHVGPLKMEAPGLREVSHPDLENVGKGIEKMRSKKNNNWALRRADTLRHALGWDISVAFGDLPLEKVDELLADLFTRVVKIKGGEYPAESLMNLLGGYNRLLRQASDLRSLKDPSAIVLGRELDIKKHPAFTKTRLMLGAALKKTARDGTNKRRKKVNHILQAHEVVVLSDLDHQIYHNQGCQKRTAFYLLVRCGIRGGDELWQLKRFDLEVKADKQGREYIQYMERHCKNNEYTLDRTKEEQFRHPYHSYEADFVLTVKQYLRHMPPWVEGNKDALFLGCIRNPASIVWFNKAFRVGKGTSNGWLENMLKLVGLSKKLFSNISGRATLITRLAARGVPEEVGMLLSGHHTADGYGRYDRTRELKKEAATMVAYNPHMSYDMALSKVSKSFLEEDLGGTDTTLKPLLDHALVSNSFTNSVLSDCSDVPVGESSDPSLGPKALQIQAGKMLQDIQNQLPKELQVKSEMTLNDPPSKLAMWNSDYDAINWDAAMKQDSKLAGLLGGLARPSSIALGSGNTFSNCQNCTIQINLPPRFNPTDFDFAKMMEFNKENTGK